MRGWIWTVMLAALTVACSEDNRGANVGDDAPKDDENAAGEGGSRAQDIPSESSSGKESGPGEPPGAHAAITSDECGLDTGFAGDDYCILPPPPDKGFQLHIGPEDYDNPDPRYILEPGEEATNDFVAVSTNEVDVYFFERQYRMRPGAHHMIATALDGAGTAFGRGRRIGTANLSQDYPADGVIPPENEGVGISLGAETRLNVSLHSINVTDKPILREVWVNFWYRDPDTVDEEAVQLFEIGDAGFAIPPGEDVVLGPYSCEITDSGRMLWLYGHRHANNVRFSTWRVRNGQRDLIYEGFDWEEVLTLEYTSLIENPVADRETMKEGGWSGVLDLMPGDKLEWECHVVNQRSGTLRFTNETYDGEMCIIDGELVGTDCVAGGGGFGGLGL